VSGVVEELLRGAVFDDFAVLVTESGARPLIEQERTLPIGVDDQVRGEPGSQPVAADNRNTR
jgi:hypothetical protein